MMDAYFLEDSTLVEAPTPEPKIRPIPPRWLIGYINGYPIRFDDSGVPLPYLLGHKWSQANGPGWETLAAFEALSDITLLVEGELITP